MGRISVTRGKDDGSDAMNVKESSSLRFNRETADFLEYKDVAANGYGM